MIGELQYRYGETKTPGGLAGMAKVGGFTDLGKFDDPRLGTDGLSLAAPASNGIARRYHQNTGIYAVIDQQIYRPRDGKGDMMACSCLGASLAFPATETRSI